MNRFSIGLILDLSYNGIIKTVFFFVYFVTFYHEILSFNPDFLLKLITSLIIANIWCSFCFTKTISIKVKTKQNKKIHKLFAMHAFTIYIHNFGKVILKRGKICLVFYSWYAFSLQCNLILSVKHLEVNDPESTCRKKYSDSFRRPITIIL